MEIKNYFAQDSEGNILPEASVYLYQRGTTNKVSVYDKNGKPKENPFTAESNGFVQFSAADGEYDLRISSSGREKVIEISMLDTLRMHFQTVARNIDCTLADGSFEQGTIITDKNQLILNKRTQRIYRYIGNIFGSLTIAAGTEPVGIETFEDVTESGYSASKILVGEDTLEKTLSDFNLTPDSQGAKGDGAINDETEINSAIEYAGSEVHLRKDKRYLVNDFNNIYGKQFTGKGHIVKEVPGGLEAQNTYADKHQRVVAQENLAAWYKNLFTQCTAPSRKLKIVFSGDSTTAGVGVDAAYQIPNLVLSGITCKGLQTPYNISCINNGHSGAHTGQWDATYVYDDIASAGDLYVIRWGINDPGWLKSGESAPIDAGQSYPGRRDITDFTASLRSGLAKVRASLPFSTTSILLMMPNSTYDIPNGRDALWYEQLRDVYIQAARDFQCAFIDTYAIMQDSRYLANILLDDPMSTSGRGIHPNDAMNSIIAGYIVNLVAPDGMRYMLSSNKVYSICGTALQPNVTLTPDNYTAAMYMTRCLTTLGWPMDGGAITFRTADDIVIQYHFGYLNADQGKLKIRFGRASVLGGQAIGWSSWYDMIGGGATYLKTAVVPSSGYSSPSSGAMRVSAEGGFRCFDGYLTKSSPSVIASGTTVGTFSTAFAPTLEAAYGTATVWDGANFEQIPVIITPAGGVTTAKATTLSAQRIYINVSYNANS